MLLLLALFSTILCIPAVASKEYIRNGSLERSIKGANTGLGTSTDWTGYRWSGHGRIAPFGKTPHGNRAVMIEGSGPSKQAISQEVHLPACHYQLSAIVAGHNLHPNHWDQSAAVYVEFSNQQEIFKNIFKGNQDWRKITLGFKVKAATKATVYFFNYGSGALFVDQISLRPNKGCRGPQLSFKIAKNALAKLNYTPPLQPADLALAGYCDNKSFSRSRVCQKLRGARLPRLQRKHARKPRKIADFSRLQPFASSGWKVFSGAKGRNAAHLFAGKYMMATPASGLVGDWSGQDWLSFSVNNASKKPQKIIVEIHDDKSTGYWSRVNYYTMAPPGLNRLQIPLQIFVGEKSVIQERRRLDLNHIKKLVFSGLEATSDLAISNVTLDPEAPYKNDFPRLIKLDVGPPGSPLARGFMPLQPNHAYRAERGYGYRAKSKIALTKDRRHPEDLFRDWTSLSRGGLDFDLPNGRYHVWMMLEDPGYWEYYPNFVSRELIAEGQKVLSEKMTYATFSKKYYRHANDEDQPGDDIWKRYIRSRYKPASFQVDVRDGQLNLTFNSFDNPYALTLSALIIYPDSQKRRGKAFINELWQKQKQQFDREYRQIKPKHNNVQNIPGNALKGDLSLFQRSAAIDVQAFEAPEKSELVRSLSLSLARGETAPLTLSLHAHKNMRLKAAHLDLPGLKVSAFKVRNKLTRLSLDGSVYWNAPRLLDPLQMQLRKGLSLPKGLVRRLWFDVKAPANFTKTSVTGRLLLTFNNGQKIVMLVSVNIHPWALPKPDIFYGYLGIAPSYPGTPWSEMTTKARKEMRAALPLLAAHGMTRFSGGLGGPVFQGYDRGRIKMKFDKADRSMDLIGRYGRGPVESYMGLAIEDLSIYRPDVDAAATYKKSYTRILGDVLSRLKKHGAKHNWREISHVVGDEPEEEAVTQSLAVAKAFKATKTQTRTSVFTSISDLSKHADKFKFAGLVDLIYLEHHSRAAIQAILKKGSQCAIYNQPTRYERGIYLFKLKKLGCSGYMQFAFNSAHVDHWYDLDGREDDQVAVFTHPDGQLRPTLDLKRYAQAIIDYRYLRKLEQMIAKSRNPAARRKAQAWLNGLLANMKVGDAHPSPWTPNDLDLVRTKAADLINQL